MTDPTPPTAQLDERFSDPGAAATPWPTTREILEGAELAWLTTVRADGRPHATPLVTVWLDDTIHFCTGPGEQKARNLAANPHVVVTTGCNTWDRGVDVTVEGTAERVTDRATLERLAAAWATKWDGQWQFQVTGEAFDQEAGGTAHVFAVRSAKVLAFAKGDRFGQTRYVRAG